MVAVRKKERRLPKLLLNIFFYLILAICILLIVVSLVNRGNNRQGLTIGSHRLLIVLSGSMSPEFSEGSAILIKEILPEEIAPGDIITFSSGSGSTLVTHRIVEIIEEEGETRFITKGDANNVNDAASVSPQQVQGVVTMWVENAGSLLLWLQSPAGLIAVFIIVAAVFFLGNLLQGRKKATEDEAGLQ